MFGEIRIGCSTEGIDPALSEIIVLVFVVEEMMISHDESEAVVVAHQPAGTDEGPGYKEVDRTDGKE